MKKTSPYNNDRWCVDDLLIRHKTLNRARGDSTKEQQNALLKRVKQYAKNLPHVLPVIKKEELAYDSARLAVFEKEYRKLKERNVKSRDDRSEGAFAETIFHILQPSPNSEKEIEEAKSKYYERLQLELSNEYEQLIRDRKTSTRQFGEWLSPMPVFSHREPFGYCQATGKSRDAIRAFLKTIKIKKAGQPPRRRGRPLILYSVDTNLRVMDQWIGKWVPQAPRDVVGFAALTYYATIGMYLRKGIEIPATAHQFKRFRRITIKHVKRVRAKIADPYIRKMADGILNDPELP